MAATFTVTGFAGAGVTLTAEVLSNIVKYEWDTDKSLLKLTDNKGKVYNISCSDLVSITTTVAANKVTAVTVA